jgi:plasmid stabilization system protein ParE
MSKKVAWSWRANENAIRLKRWLKETEGQDYADRYMEGILRILGRLAEHPTKGILTYKHQGVLRRKLDRHNYVLYKITDDGILILNLLSYHRKRKRF